MPKRTHQLDRLPPHSLEAEQGLLGCLLLNPQENIPISISELAAGPESLYDLRHRTVYESILKLADEGKPVDLIALVQRLRDEKQIDHVGGLPFLSTLQDSVPCATHISYYLGIIKEKAALRRLIATCTDYVGKAFEPVDSAHKLIEEFERDALAVRVNSGKEGKSFSSLLEGAVRQVEKVASTTGILGVPTGYVDLDDATEGLQGGEVIVIAARPSQGKTSLAMNIAENAAKAGNPVGVFSLEMSDHSLTLRMLLSRAKTSLRAIRRMTVEDKQEVSYAIAESHASLSWLPLHIMDCPGATIERIQSLARRLKQQHAIKLLVIDYMQLVQTSQRRDSMREQVTDISQGIKRIARELDIPVIVLSQLNRDVEQRKGKPRLSDLRESGAIEQDADEVWFIHFPDDDECEPQRRCELLRAKARNGAVGKIEMVFLKKWTRFESAAKVEDKDMPQNETVS
jgi:replicative DNA helicase